MLSAILILLAMPYTDLSRSRGIQFRPLSKIAFYIFVANFLILMVLGAKHVESPFIELGQISTLIYFSHFLIIVPLVSLFENSLIELTTTTATNKQKVFSRNINLIGTQKRYFSTTRTLNSDSEDSSSPVRDDPVETDSKETLIAKCENLFRHRANIHYTGNTIVEVKTTGSLPTKINLVKTLIDGDSRYEHVVVTRQNCDHYLNRLLEEQTQAGYRVRSLIFQANA